ncbi:hypothetical protein ABEB36_009909 [Hypothenemus hampei]|uniref:C-type lectin domain-containing protein n=1 Tax=Hypothenemus hampei TaxID=57062 RepID=A0ABD1EHV5_HYPHA
MSVQNRRMFIVYAIVALFGIVQSRAVNISNTWMLPEEGFPVFYRYFRDRISWYEADAVCQFHHANLVTADSSSQYDAIRAYLKELDITEKIWIGLSKPQEKTTFLWTDYKPLSGEGHWQETLPTGDGQSLCAVMDPTADFLWRALPCGGPEVAAFICELPIPTWAIGPRGCLLTELPSLTVLYIPEQSALELTSDCGLDGTKRIACKGNADHEEMLRQLTCAIANEDLEDDKQTTKTSTTDYMESSSVEDNSVETGKTTIRSWTANTVINAEYYGTSTRHRRETEDTLSPVSTKSSFKETSPTGNLTWQEVHQEKIVLTTQEISTLDDQFTTSTLPTSLSTNQETKEPSTATDQTVLTTVLLKSTDQSTTIHDKQLEEPSSNITGHENIEDYPSAINQGQLFSIIDNGTMFDIIELNETEQQNLKPNSDMEPLAQTVTEEPKKKISTKKPLQPTKRVTELKKDVLVNRLSTTTQKSAVVKQMPSVDEIEEKLTKEFEMMPDIKDTEPTQKLNRTFRKELPLPEVQNRDYGVPKIVNFTIINALEVNNDDEGYQRDQPVEEVTVSTTQSPGSVVKKTKDKLQETQQTSKIIETVEVSKRGMTASPPPHHQNPVDPRIYLVDHQIMTHPHNHSEYYHRVNHTTTTTTEQPMKLSKEDFLPKSLLGEQVAPLTSTIATMEVSEEFSEHSFPSDEPKKINRHRSLHPTNKGRKFYPYFFSRMLG